MNRNERHEYDKYFITKLSKRFDFSHESWNIFFLCIFSIFLDIFAILLENIKLSFITNFLNWLFWWFHPPSWCYLILQIFFYAFDLTFKDFRVYEPIIRILSCWIFPYSNLIFTNYFPSDSCNSFIIWFTRVIY